MIGTIGDICVLNLKWRVDGYKTNQRILIQETLCEFSDFKHYICY